MCALGRMDAAGVDFCCCCFAVNGRCFILVVGLQMKKTATQLFAFPSSVFMTTKITMLNKYAVPVGRLLSARATFALGYLRSTDHAVVTRSTEPTARPHFLAIKLLIRSSPASEQVMPRCK